MNSLQDIYKIVLIKSKILPSNHWFCWIRTQEVVSPEGHNSVTLKWQVAVPSSTFIIEPNSIVSFYYGKE